MRNPGRKRIFLAVLTVLVIASVAIVLFVTKPWQSRKPGAPDTSVGEGGSSESKPPKVGTPGKAPGKVEPKRQPAAPNHLVLGSNRGPLAALLVTDQGDKGPLLCLPLACLPLEGELSLGAEPLDVAVRHVDWDNGTALIAVRNLSDMLPEGKRALQIGDGRTLKVGALCEVARVGRERSLVSSDQVRITGRIAGSILLETRLRQGSVVLEKGRAVALVTADAKPARLISHLRSWLRTTAEDRSLAATQKLMRKRDPHLVLRDANALLASEPLTRGKVEDALGMLQEGRHLVRDWKTGKAFDDLLQIAIQNRVRLVWRTDVAEAAKIAAEALQQFPSHKGLLADVVRLALEQDQANQAANHYQSLLLLSAEHAKSLTDAVGNGLLRIARGRLRAKRNQEALRILRRAVDLFPARADLRLALAQSLLRGEFYAAALVQANEAARLDRSYRKQVASFEKAAKRSRQPGVYQIPFDPDTRVILTKARVQGVEVRFLVDTGASMTTIPTSLAKRLGLLNNKNRRVRMNTASGTVEVPVVVLPSLRLGPLRAKKVEAAVLDLPGRNLRESGLLGMNVLRNWNVQIDSQNGRLILKQAGRRR